MKLKTLEAALAWAVKDALAAQRLHDSVERIEREPTETIAVVEVKDYSAFKDQQTTIKVQHAEIAQLRMLLKEALGQLERIFTTTKVASPEYRRLVTRAEVVLTHRGDDE